MEKLLLHLAFFNQQNRIWYEFTISSKLPLCKIAANMSRIGFSIIAILYGLSFAYAQDPNPICYVCSDGGVSTITKPDVLIPLPDDAGQSEATCEMIRLSAEIFLLIPADQCFKLDREDFRILCGCENALNQTTTKAPTAVPIAVPTPVALPTALPIQISTPDTKSPTIIPTKIPTTSPTKLPTAKPTLSPTTKPTTSPVTSKPTIKPTALPVKDPTTVPVKAQTAPPSSSPVTSSPITSAPVALDQIAPTLLPTPIPVVTGIPSTSPSDVPSDAPSDEPSATPSDIPSDSPSSHPNSSPTFETVEEEDTDDAQPTATINPRLKNILERFSDFFNTP